MSDKELITFLRRKYNDLLMAVLSYEECIDETTPERIAEVRAALDGYSAAQAETSHAVVMEALSGATNEKRAVAWQKVREAGTMTFQEAVLVDPEMTDEQRAHWLAAE